VRESRGDLRVSVFDPLEDRPLTIS